MILQGKINFLSLSLSDNDKLAVYTTYRGKHLIYLSFLFKHNFWITRRKIFHWARYSSSLID